MACVRGAQQLRQRPVPEGSPSECYFGLPDVMVRTGLCLTLPEVGALNGACQQTREACGADMLWEELHRRRWGGESAARGAGRPAAGPEPGPGGWREAFLARLRRAQAAFLLKTLPGIVQKSKRKDGLPFLQKIHDALRLKYAISVGSPGRGQPAKWLPLSTEAVQTFTSSACMRCSFSSVKLRPPVRIEVLARSAALGVERVLLSAFLDDAQAWGEPLATDEHFRFLRSPCGGLLLALWQDEGLVAGLFATLHYVNIFRHFLEGSCNAAWETLAGRPPPDDIDSRLGLHDYNMLLTLRSAKVESFSNCFYKIAALKEGGFGSVRVRSACVVERGGPPPQPEAASAARGPARPRQPEAAAAAAAARHAPPEADAASAAARAPGRAAPPEAAAAAAARASRASAASPEAAAAARGPARPGRRAGGGAGGAGGGDCVAEVAHFEVVAPHESGTQPPFPCLRPPQLAFQTLAFRTILQDALFLDVTVFDEHGRAFWVSSAVVSLQADAPPHESGFAAQRFAAIDFDRETHEQGQAVRWICLAERGAAQLVVQLEYQGGIDSSTGERALPRLNHVTWHPELPFLDAWWGSSYAKQQRR